MKLATIAMACALLAACSAAEPKELTDAQSAAPTATVWVYWPQDSDLDVLREGPEPPFVLDYSRDGTGDEAFTAADISSLRDRPNAARDVIAHMSIGEAEGYRYYWQDGWTAG